MASLSDFEELLPSLSRGEKAQVLKWVVRELGDAFPGIDSRPEVCGGEPASFAPESRCGFWNKAAAGEPRSRSCCRRIRPSARRIWSTQGPMRARTPVEIGAQIRENESA
jgi:hypothetical protein